MKSFLSKVTRRLKVHRKPIADCDCSDFIEAVPQSPSQEYLKKVIKARYFGGTSETEEEENNQESQCEKENNDCQAKSKVHFNSAFSIDEEAARSALVRSTLFDLMYRCGAEGRCTCNGAPQCRFPNCFVMRPVMKGAEVYSSRLEFEVDDAPSQEIANLVKMARENHMEEVIERIESIVSRELRTASHGRPLAKPFETCNSGKDNGKNEEFNAANTPLNYTKSGYSSFENKSVDSTSTTTTNDISKNTTSKSDIKQNSTNSDTFHIEVNPLKDSVINGEVERVKIKDLIISLYRWRAALQVNVRDDAKAVHSLLNLASALHPHERTLLYATATRWAVLNDMEIIYYRHVIESFQFFEYAFAFAMRRPMLLPRVFEYLNEDETYIEDCTHLVLSCEIEAIASKAQAAQVYDDLTEDPMFGLYLPMALSYYRFRVHNKFWKKFFNLLCLPPMESSSAATVETEPNDQNNLIVEEKVIDDGDTDKVSRSRNRAMYVADSNDQHCKSTLNKNYESERVSDSNETNTGNIHESVKRKAESEAAEAQNTTIVDDKRDAQVCNTNIKPANKNTINMNDDVDETDKNKIKSSWNVTDGNSNSDNNIDSKDDLSCRSWPPHIVDAIGRSMILHHLIKYAEARNKEIDKGIVQKRVKKMLKNEQLVHDADFDYILEPSQIMIAATRLRQLLMLIKEHEVKHHEQMLLLSKMHNNDNKNVKSISGTIKKL